MPSRHFLTLYILLAVIVAILVIWLLARVLHYILRQAKHLLRDRHSANAQ